MSGAREASVFAGPPGRKGPVRHEEGGAGIPAGPGSRPDRPALRNATQAREAENVRPTTRPKGPARPSGFTLVEMMIGLVLLLILTGIAIMIYRETVNFRRSATARIRRSAEVRGIFAVIGRDLAGAFPFTARDPLDPLPVFEIIADAPDDDGDVLTLAAATENAGPLEFAHVRYRAAGGRLYREVHREDNGNWSGEEESVLAEGVREVRFAAQGSSSPEGIPEWVMVTLRMEPILDDEEPGSDEEHRIRLPVPAGGAGP